MAVILLAVATENGYTLPGDTNKLLAESSCVTCLADKQMLQALASMFTANMLPGVPAATVRAQIKCLLCANPRQIKAAILTQICKLKIGANLVL
jgi:hypothetical protein